MPTSNVFIPVFGSLFSSVVPADRAFDADTLAWEAQVIVNGGTVSLARRIIVDNFIFAEKASGAWALTDDYWALWGENAPQALTSLKQRRFATAVNAPTFTADRGYAFDGATNYLNTGFICSTHAVAMTGTRLRLGVYERANVSASTFAAGANTSTTSQLRIIPRSAANRIVGYSNSDFVQTATTVTDSRGFSVVQRTGSTYTGFKNGLPIAVSAPGSESSSPTSTALAIGAYMAGSPLGFRASSIGFACVGADLSSAQELAQYNAIQTFATAVGAQV